MSFENIFTHGNLVDISVGKWTGKRKLQPEDLGINADTIPETFYLGSKKLIPEDVLHNFNHLDYQARQALDRYSFSFEFGSARFVPKKRFIEFAQVVDKIIEEYNKAADELTANYDRYRLQVRQQFVQAAHAAYARLKTHKGYTKDEDEYVNEFLARTEEYYPKPEEIRSKFYMEYTVFQVALPDLSQASYADLAEESEKIKLMQAAYQKSLSKKVESFVDNIVNEQRGRVQDVLERFSRALLKEGRVHQNTIDMVSDMVIEYEKMDIIGDDKFLGILKEMKIRLVDKYKSKDLRRNKDLRKKIADEVSMLACMAADRTVISQLASNYRQKINL